MQFLNTFIITRGLPGSGKSTFIEKNLSKYFKVVSPDELRIKYNGLEEKEDGTLTISQRNQGFIWRMAIEMIKDALAHSENIVLDATCCGRSDVKKYYKLAKKYNAKFYIIDFTDIPLEVCKARNKTRMPAYKRVSDEILDRMAKTLALPLNEELLKFIIKADKFESILK